MWAAGPYTYVPCSLLWAIIFTCLVVGSSRSCPARLPQAAASSSTSSAIQPAPTGNPLSTQPPPYSHAAPRMSHPVSEFPISHGNIPSTSFGNIPSTSFGNAVPPPFGNTIPPFHNPFIHYNVPAFVPSHAGPSNAPCQSLATPYYQQYNFVPEHAPYRPNE